MHGRTGRVLAALVLPMLLAAERAADPPAAGDPLTLGRQIYNARCYFCHGYSGDARTLASSYLQPPPRDFTASPALTRERIVDALRRGRAGTAMKSFSGLLDEAEIGAVATFVERQFVQAHELNTTYHTPQNGWPDHLRYRAAFPFATGAIALDTPADALDAAQRTGRALFLGSCVSCHDRARVAEDGPAWTTRPISYPRLDFVPGDHTRPVVDAVASASVYARHDVVPAIAGLTPMQRRGEALFQANCAFCHGADGTGRNWIGQFMEPHARDLTQLDGRTLPVARLRATIRDGMPGTSMPAWGSVLRRNEIDAVAVYVVRAFYADGREVEGGTASTTRQPPRCRRGPRQHDAHRAAHPHSSKRTSAVMWRECVKSDHTPRWGACAARRPRARSSPAMTCPDTFDSTPMDQLADIANGDPARQAAAELHFLRMLMRLWPASRRQAGSSPADSTR